MDKAGPRLGHEAGQISVALTFVREGIDSIAQALGVIKDERDLLEVRNLDGPLDTGNDSVEAVAKGRDISTSPCLAGQTAVGYENLVTKVGGTVSVFCPIRSG